VISVQPLVAGEQFVVAPYPFIRSSVTLCGEEGPYAVQGWRPGTLRPESFSGLGDPVAHGEGKQRLTVVTVCPLPGRYQDRVFYLREWEDPDGKVFGKKQVRICGIQKFAKILSGYGYPYALPGQPSPWEVQQAEYDAALLASYEQEVGHAG
jgi:hypothetical protein